MSQSPQTVSSQSSPITFTTAKLLFVPFFPWFSEDLSNRKKVNNTQKDPQRSVACTINSLQVGGVPQAAAVLRTSAVTVDPEGLKLPLVDLKGEPKTQVSQQVSRHPQKMERFSRPLGTCGI